MEASVPFVTRTARRSCQPLAALVGERHPELVRAALLPLDGHPAELEPALFTPYIGRNHLYHLVDLYMIYNNIYIYF